MKANEDHSPELANMRDGNEAQVKALASRNVGFKTIFYSFRLKHLKSIGYSSHLTVISTAAFVPQCSQKRLPR